MSQNTMVTFGSVDVYVGERATSTPQDQTHPRIVFRVALVTSGTAGTRGGREHAVVDTGSNDRHRYRIMGEHEATPETLRNMTLLGTYPASAEASTRIAAEHFPVFIQDLRKKGYIERVPTSAKVREICRDLSDRVKKAKERGTRATLARATRRVARAGSNAAEDVFTWCLQGIRGMGEFLQGLELDGDCIGGDFGGCDGGGSS
ncbi:uncharacterized protein DSM5745_04497 [Aspergillus mulundensis]|uniref:Uncharacterized protein n=1 Tax=Aspergillus mulundensis TaxID=1810919 RepID=A0A3D8SDD0_9EURO|nr:hypothetical protein DSM5745_04497 [Aspergillus mulundensis]RDW84171.1 hypothetical protein DSM5745_04497 [Aspergillus mulundensis]